MILDTNAFQSKPPSLEEGPMTSKSDVESGAHNQVEESNNYQRCLGLIKLILYLELIVFVGWIGCIFISNYYSYHPYTNDSTPHDQLDWKNDFHSDHSDTSPKPMDWEDDFLTNTQTTSPDNIVTRFKENIGAIINADRGRTTTTSVIPDEKVSVETEAPISSNEKTTEASDEIPLSGWSGILNIPDFEDDDILGSVEENNNSEKFDSDTIIDRIIFPDDSEYSGTNVPKSGLIHVIDYHIAALNAASKPNVSRPFPRLPWLDSNMDGSTLMPEVENDSSTAKLETTESSGLLEEYDELENPRDEPEEDYSDSRMKEILFPIFNWNDYSQQSDADDDVVVPSKESSSDDEAPHLMSSERMEDVSRILKYLQRT